MQISHNYTYITSLLSLSPLPQSLSHHLGHYRVPGWAHVIEKLFTIYLFYTWWCIYVCATFSICPTLSFPHCVHKSILSICASTPSLQRRSLIRFFQIHIYVLIFYIYFFSLNYFILYNRLLGLSTSLELTQIHFYGWIIFHCMYVPHLLYHSSVSGHLVASMS